MRGLKDKMLAAQQTDAEKQLASAIQEMMALVFVGPDSTPWRSAISLNAKFEELMDLFGDESPPFPFAAPSSSIWATFWASPQIIIFHLKSAEATFLPLERKQVDLPPLPKF